MLKGFEPVFDGGSKILILGSFPSVKSREVNFYYGNPQNRFWRTLESALGESPGKTVREKIDFLRRHHLALWDIAENCDITGSSDSQIKNVKVSDLSVILNYAKIKKILCNGKKAFEIFQKYYAGLKIRCSCMPSTSPANIKFDCNEWIKELHMEDEQI